MQDIKSIPCTVHVEITVSGKHHQELAQKFLKRCERWENLSLKLLDYCADNYLLRFEGTTSNHVVIDDGFVKSLRADATDVCVSVTGFMNQAKAFVRADKCCNKVHEEFSDREDCGWYCTEFLGEKIKRYHCSCYEYDDFTL